jgi:hypothetical protein
MFVYRTTFTAVLTSLTERTDFALSTELLFTLLAAFIPSTAEVSGTADLLPDLRASRAPTRAFMDTHV